MTEDSEAENLGESFQQSRREFRFMVVVWIVFAAWTGIYISMATGASDAESLKLVWGMPEWVFFGVLLPWSIGLALTVWFALCFMKDTDLDGGSLDSLPGEEGE